MRKFYLAHPFDARERVRAWELELEESGVVELVNPFYDAPDRSDVEEIDAGRAERYEKLIPSDLVGRDLRQIEGADGTVAIIDGSVSYGTIMEIVYTEVVYKKPVYIICTNGHHQHPWLRFHSTAIFTTPREFEQWLLNTKE
jgi:nucleoside 2-deoxyribosyltransferase